ncbi:MAG: cell division protein FtsZ [Candidatus Micrarchaeaceae archaeon]|jgi:cell division protein FtsZ
MVKKRKPVKKDKKETSKPRIVSPDDQEISKFAQATKTRIYVIGVGGSGSNTMTRMSELHIEGANLIATNTDAPHLENTIAHRKILLGKTTTKGLGTGSDPALGEKAAVESMEEIKRAVSDAQMVFINCGLGGGTGTGAAPVIAGTAKEAGALTVALVTLPFSSEGKTRMKNALQGLSRLRKNTDTTIVIPNDKLLAFGEGLTLDKAFKKIDDLLADATKGILEMVTKPGMVNLDFADLKGVLKDSGYAVIGVGESHSTKEDKRIETAIDETLGSPLLDIDMTKAKKALVSISGGSDLTLREAENVFHAVSSRINEDAMMKWGARIDPKMHKKTLRVMVIMSGLELAKYVENSLQESVQAQLNIDELGIDEIDFD